MSSGYPPATASDRRRGDSITSSRTGCSVLGLLPLYQHRLVLRFDGGVVGIAENLIEFGVLGAPVQSRRFHYLSGEVIICDGVAHEWLQIRVEISLAGIFNFLGERIEIAVFLRR